MTEKRLIGDTRVFPIGLGCMNLSHAYGLPASPAEAAALIDRALDLGVDFFDTAALYGFGKNEALVGPLLKPHRRRILLASKCGMTGVNGKRVIDGRPETLKRTCEDSLRRLGTDVIDLYYLHRFDKTVPVEDSVGALADLVADGKIRMIGLSEVSADTLRRAVAVHRIAAVQTEYSLWTRNPEVAVLEACRDLGVAFVAFSPVARGFLANPGLDPADFIDGDIRRTMPRFQEPHFSANRDLIPPFCALAREAGLTPAGLALGWLLAKAPHIVPIPGTSKVAHLEDDIAAARTPVAADILKAADALINTHTVSGPRYGAATQTEIDTEELA